MNEGRKEFFKTMLNALIHFAYLNAKIISTLIFYKVNTLLKLAAC